ncbi:MAG: TolC family protein [Alphaproteobacteria bacterium]
MATIIVPRAPRAFVAVGFLSSLLGACANFSGDGGMEPVSKHVSAELGADAKKIASKADAEAIRERVKTLLEKPLTAESAVQIALLNNRGLQARYNFLGISEAAFVEASIPPNPTISIERIAGTGFVEIDRRLAINLLSLLTLPARKDIAENQFRAMQFKTIESTFRVAAETRRAYYKAVAAQQFVRYFEQAKLSADAAADLTRRLGETGASSKLAQARAASFYVEISTRLARARLAARLQREALTRALGLWGADVLYTLPDALPPLPASLPSEEEVEVEAVKRRVDLMAARLDLDATARALGLTEATRFVSALDLAGISRYEKVDGESSYPKGFDIVIQIPIFDLGEVNVRRASESYMLAVNHFAELAVNVRSEARAANQTYRAAYDITREYQNQVLPLRQIVNEQVLLQYNGMLVDAFELLGTARESIASNAAAIEALRDFYLAEIDYKAAIIGGGSSGLAFESLAGAPKGGE